MSAERINEQRKTDHLTICLDHDVGHTRISTGLERYVFVHQALPELDLTAIDLSTCLFGKRIAAPLVVSPMVGGIEAAAGINRCLAEAAQVLNLGMGVGSQRCMIENPLMAFTYRVRDVAPDIPLFANLGAVQLNCGYGIEECRRAVESIGADALILHLNPLQEALQPEGNTNFSRLVEKIDSVCRGLSVPVIVKEVGSGISGDIAGKLAQAGVAGIDVAGAGGTSWSRIESMRAGERTARLAEDFAGWGISTAVSIQMVREKVPEMAVIASGGIKTGMDIAKCIALGADAAGIALPLLRPGTLSTEAVIETLLEIIDVLRITMFCTGTPDIPHLKRSPHLVPVERE